MFEFFLACIDCFYSCMSKMNQPIANYKQLQSNGNMDCYCARNPKSLQCNGQGSYKEFQKFEDIKYCVDKDGFRKTRQYYYTEDRGCRIPKCECFSEAVAGCSTDLDACMVCDENNTNCHECPECPETDCN